jgi:serine/threonine protein kinase
MEGKSPFIVEGLFCYEDEDYIYQVMEKAKGGNLYNYISEKYSKSFEFKNLGE